MPLVPMGGRNCLPSGVIIIRLLACPLVSKKPLEIIIKLLDLQTDHVSVFLDWSDSWSADLLHGNSILELNLFLWFTVVKNQAALSCRWNQTNLYPLKLIINELYSVPMQRINLHIFAPLSCAIWIINVIDTEIDINNCSLPKFTEIAQSCNIFEINS